MDFSSSDPGTIVINLLEGRSKGMSSDEIAFKMRSTPSKILGVLGRLKKAKIISETETGNYMLNQRDDDYTFEELSDTW